MPQSPAPIFASILVFAITGFTQTAGAQTAINHQPADAGFQTTYDTIVSAAEKEPPMHFCQTFSREEWGLFIDGFKKQFPNIQDIETSDCLGTEPRERVFIEWQANRNDVDVMNAGGDMMDRIGREKIGAAPDWSVFDGTPLQIDKADIAFDGRIVGVGSSTNAIIFNKKLVSRDQVPQSFKECADPKFKGQLIVDVRPGTGFAMMPEIYGDDGTKEWAAALAANEPLWARSPAPIATALLQGERPIVCGLQIHGILRGFAKAAPAGVLEEPTDFDFVVPPDHSNSPGYVTPVIAAHPKAPNTALLFIAYAASNPDAISAVNPGYGSPYAKGSWKAEYFEHAGVKPNDPPGGRWAAAEMAEHAAEIILEAWGHPQPAVK